MGVSITRTFLAFVTSALVCAQIAYAQAAASPPDENARYLAELRKAIAGREKQPAREVWKSLSILVDGPADRVLRVMEEGYSKALGVSCTYCHVPDRWESEEKQAKQSTRAMVALVSSILKELRSIPGLSSRNPTVNCTTCHRGEAQPALELPPVK